MAWLSNQFGEMYQVEDPVYNTYAEELAATQAATAGATSNYYDASANGGEGGQVYVYSNGSTVTTNNIGQPTSATLPTSQYQGTGGANSSEFRPIEGSPTSTIIGGTKNAFGDITGGFQVGIETPTLIGQNNQISYDEYGQPNTLRVQPELSNFDKAMRAGTIALAVAPWVYGAATGFGGASSAGAGLAGAEAAGSGSWGLTPELAAELGLEGSTSGLATDGILGSQAIESLGLGAEAAGSGSWGLSPELAAELGLDYSTSGLTDLSGKAGSALLESMGLNTGMALPSWLSSLTGPLSKLGTGSLASALRQGGGTSGINPSLLSSLGKLAQGQSGMGMEIPGIVRTNTNPFYNTPQVALQTPQKTETSQIADLLRQGKPSWQT